ncbi:LytR C-terminal domain-containing protein [Melioribacteraceae bacterium 4301-Me]|uniref:LytR C-terminal domain-containing protein n=1 Tax=Pyranulibacter aquaticus TaxID=3163344 RepID=UPI00359537D3
MKNPHQKNKDKVDLRTSTINLLLNVAIFVLFAVIIYMSFSLYVKLHGTAKDLSENFGSQTPSDIIQVEVLNGCGVSGVADRFTDFLRNNNFDVVNVGNYIAFDISNSLVIDRIGNMANAYKVAKALGISNNNVIQQLNKNYFLDVTVIIGRDYFNLNPLK